MWTLGLAGGLDRLDAGPGEASVDFGSGYAHDAAAVLLRDGEVVVAIEQERLDRIKHSDRLPREATEFCLREAGLTLADLDQIAIFTDAAPIDAILLGRFVNHVMPELKSTKQLLLERLGDGIDPDKLVFVGHHHAHAMSAYAMSGYADALVLTADGSGSEGACATVYEGRAGVLTRIRQHHVPHSLGHFYVNVIGYLGYGYFEEYKVMGLAPYGDPSRFRALFEKLYEITPDGWFKMRAEIIRPEALWTMMRANGCGEPRRRGEDFNQTHRDLAAALQETVETILFHFFRHNRKESGLSSLCYAGGVAHNVTFNGKLLAERTFDRMFIHPASHDAGNAIGAALVAYRAHAPAFLPTQRSHVYWGTDTPKSDEVGARLARWKTFVTARVEDDICGVAAELLADDKVLGWVQGRSEFGPRALGNRSIIADPRPSANKTRINAMIKKREGYRPFAPSVLEEKAGALYELGEGADHRFMLYSVMVKPEHREALGAVTHVDGSARVQTVSRDVNPRYWELISKFDARTGVPVVLNTSFNNDAEPIIDSVDDAIVCFLTTGLDYLVVGDHVVTRNEVAKDAILDLRVTLPVYRSVHRAARPRQAARVQVKSAFKGHRVVDVTEAMASALERADGTQTLRALGVTGVDEARALWEKRVIVLQP